MTYHGEEQGIIDFAESPVYDSGYDEIDYDPLDYIYDDDDFEGEEEEELPFILEIGAVNPERMLP